MALPLIGALPAGIQALKAGLPLGIKALKYFVDSTFRDKVAPVPGSVLYCDLWVAVEHSGIYVGGGDISNIVVDGVAESTVCRSSPESFTSKSVLGRKIYVSCNSAGAVGHAVVARCADAQPAGPPLRRADDAGQLRPAAHLGQRPARRERPGLAPPVDPRRRATHRPAVALGRGRQQRGAARPAATADDWPGRAPYATISAFPVTA